MKNLINNNEVRRYLQGTPLKIKELIGKAIYIIDYCKIKSTKEDCDYYYSFSFIMMGENNGQKRPLAFFTHTGAYEIKGFFDRIDKYDGIEDSQEESFLKLPLPVKVCEDGKSIFFDGYRTYNADVAQDILSNYNLDLSKLTAIE